MSNDGSKPLKCGNYERFVIEAIACGDLTRAMLTVYPKRAKWKPEALWTEASRLAASPKVSPRLDFLKTQAAEKASVTREQVLAAWRDLAMTDLPDIVYFDGVATLTITDFEKLTKAQRRCIKKIKFRREAVKGSKGRSIEHVELEFYDKQKALDSLSRHFGLYAADNQRAITGLDGGPVEVAATMDFGLLTPKERAQLHKLGQKAQVDETED